MIGGRPPQSMADPPSSMAGKATDPARDQTPKVSDTVEDGWAAESFGKLRIPLSGVEGDQVERHRRALRLSVFFVVE